MSTILPFRPRSRPAHEGVPTPGDPYATGIEVTVALDMGEDVPGTLCQDTMASPLSALLGGLLGGGLAFLAFNFLFGA